MTHPLPRFLTTLVILTVAGSACSAQPWVVTVPTGAVADDHLHIFLVNGLDPLRFGNLAGLGDRLQERGFHHTYYGELTHVRRFQEMIRQIHHHDPLARFALIGFSLGANRVCELARSLQDDGITIDMVVFLSGNHWLGGLPNERPENVGRVINIRASGCLKFTGRRDWAENHQLKSTRHFGTPARDETLDLVTEALSGGATVLSDQ